MSAYQYRTLEYRVDCIGDLNLKVSTDTSGSKQVLNYATNPSESFIGNSSLSIMIACDEFHTDTDAGDKDACVQIECGNGFRIETEDCDDGNNINGDG